MATQFRCGNERRRQLVAESTKLNGIDYLEVDPDGTGTLAGQKTLAVHFLHPLPGQPDGIPTNPPLNESHLMIDGGARITGITVAEKPQANGSVLTVVVSNAGDFSTYTLRLVASSRERERPPDGFDPQLAAVGFSFKVACPSEFDCESAVPCASESLAEPDINYIAKDYQSFRRLLLDRLSATLPAWRERNPADIQMTLVETLAYVADHLSYYQDAVATEAYLGTARRRVSVRRHARLLDYHVHDGVNARTWAVLEIRQKPTSAGPKEADGMALSAGTRILTRTSVGDARIEPGDEERAVRDQPTVFETLHDITLSSAHNRIRFYTWGDSECCLPRGSTRATLLDQPMLTIVPGDVLILEETSSPETGREADADPTHRHAVRLIRADRSRDPLDSTPVVEVEWDRADALPFPLCLSALVAANGGTPDVVEASVARGNVVLTDHGRTLEKEPLDPPSPVNGSTYRPRVFRSGLTFAVTYNDEVFRHLPAATALIQDARQALPSVTLDDGDEMWEPRHDLTSSDRFAREFVVETESDGTAQIRFGDDVLGLAPPVGANITGTYRVGNGKSGNVGAEALSHVVTELTGIERVRNPLPAQGGVEPETLEEVRQYAPQAFRTQERAVTEADWATAAERDSRVQKAAATFRWTGSWYTAFVTVDRQRGEEIGEAFEESLRASLERYRVAGYDLEINGPRYVPLDIVLQVCVGQGYFRSDVKQDLLRVFSAQDLGDGRTGFFHADRFTLGQPVYLSRIYETALSLAGVASVDAMAFQRWGRVPMGEKQAGLIRPNPLEIVRLDNDPSFPENGKIDFKMLGGM